MDIDAYRAHPREQVRITSLLEMVPENVATVLDVGARDGYLSRKLADRGLVVTALDLTRPAFNDPRIACIQGDATALRLPDRAFDLVLCAEVLEHVPVPGLQQACRELQRVASHYILVGVPYQQDIRVGRLTCHACGGVSPPWGHVNQFNKESLQALFADSIAQRIELVGERGPDTNALSTRLMDWAGNPWASYGQDEPCVHCGDRFLPPPPPTLKDRVLARVSLEVGRLRGRQHSQKGNWIHCLYARSKSSDGL